MTNYVALLRGIGPLNPNMRNKGDRWEQLVFTFPGGMILS
jgi:hypothetical protein